MSFGDTVKAFFRDPFVQQFGIFTGLVALAFGLSQNISGGGSILNSAGTATSVILAITLIVLPISYIMNYAIYHSRAMRFGSGIVGWLMGGIVWVYILFRSIGAMLGTTTKIPYFGMFPLFEPAPPAPSEGSWFMTAPRTILIDPFTKLFDIHIGGDVNRMEALLAPYIAPAGAQPVNETLIERAQQIAAYAKEDADAARTAIPEFRDKAVIGLAAIRENMRKTVAAGGSLDTFIRKREETLTFIGAK